MHVHDILVTVGILVLYFKFLYSVLKILCIFVTICTTDEALYIMLQGHMPKHELLQKYDLLQFADVARAVR